VIIDLAKHTKLKTRKKRDLNVYCDYTKHCKEQDIKLRLIRKEEIILKTSNQWKNNSCLFKPSVPDQMKATDEKNIA